jgi:hypothetical protein
MGRGIRLACEQCDFATSLSERISFAFGADGQIHALPPGSTVAPDGYWSDWLCGTCRLPRRQVLPAVAGQGTPDAASARPRCPECGVHLLPFESALWQLAGTSHSRVRLDLVVERTGYLQLEEACAAIDGLRQAYDRGDCTTQAALDTLAGQVTPNLESRHGTDLVFSHVLADLATQIENASGLDVAATLLAERRDASSRHISILEEWSKEEAELPGVPCPHCGTGQLVHWPIWD